MAATVIVPARAGRVVTPPGTVDPRAAPGCHVDCDTVQPPDDDT